METISPRYVIILQKTIKAVLYDQFSDSEIRTYLEHWITRDISNTQNFSICLFANGDIDVERTLSGVDDETLLKIAIDLEIETPDYLPSIPMFKNELKASYKTASKTFELACRKVESEPNIAITLANSALESVIKEILKEEGVNKDVRYNSKDTLGKLIEKCLKKFNAYPSCTISSDVKQLGSGLISCCHAIERLRSDKTIVAHGKTDSDFIIDDPTSALFVVNAVTTIGLFLLKQYQNYYPIKELNTETEMPF